MHIRCLAPSLALALAPVAVVELGPMVIFRRVFSVLVLWERLDPVACALRAEDSGL